MKEPKLFNNLVKKAIDADKKFKEFRIPINIDITFNDLKAALFESNDYIEALKAEIERLKKSQESADKIFNSINEERIKYRNELAALKEECRWRKCSEELPTENDANESGKLLGYLGGYKIAHEYHWTDVRDKLYGITHWMPMPKAPEETI